MSDQRTSDPKYHYQTPDNGGGSISAHAPDCDRTQDCTCATYDFDAEQRSAECECDAYCVKQADDPKKDGCLLEQRPSNERFKYEGFGDWFHEQEGFHLRSERTAEDVLGIGLEKWGRMVEWLKAAFEAGRAADVATGSRDE